MKIGLKEMALAAVSLYAAYLFFRPRSGAVPSPSSGLDLLGGPLAPFVVDYGNQVAANAPNATQQALPTLGGPAWGAFSQFAISNQLSGPAIAQFYTALGMPAPSTNNEIARQQSLLDQYRYG